MSEPNVQEAYFRTVRDGDVETVNRLLDDHREVLATLPMLNSYLHDAARFDRVAVMEVLVARGADIHAPANAFEIGGPIHRAASLGSANAVRWLLEHGAEVVTGDEDEPCPGLEFAAMDGHLECVRLLVEGGAPLDTAGRQALHLAEYHDHPEVAAYLRSIGVRSDEDEAPARTPLTAEAGEGLADLRQHLRQQVPGTLSPDAFQEVLPGEPPLRVLVIDQFDVCKALVTEGMSSLAMNGPIPYAELILFLPSDWPIGQAAFQDERNAWPVLWLWRLARLPHQAGAGYETAVLFDYEEPLGPETRFTAFLLLAEAGDRGSYTRSDGQKVVLYAVVPIYPEENAFAEREGVRRLLTLFDEKGVSQVLANDRPSVIDRI